METKNINMPFNGLTLGSVVLYNTQPQPIMAVIMGITHNPYNQQTDYRLYLLEGENKGECTLCKLEKTSPMPLTEIFLDNMRFIKAPIEGYPGKYTFMHPNGMELIYDETDKSGFVFVFHKKQITITHVHTLQLFFNLYNISK